MGTMTQAGTGHLEHRTLSWRKFGTIFACGMALFMDGYANNTIGIVSKLLKILYPDTMDATTVETLNAIAFAGTVVGMLLFGYYSDAIGRKSGMIVSTLIILVFTALSAGSYYKGSSSGMVKMLTAWRFFAGIGIGAEYPTGSVAAAEQTEELPRFFQHGPFVLATNLQLVLGGVAANFVPLILTWIVFDQYGAKGNNQLIWRLTVGLGVVPCLLVLPFRLLINQPKMYKENMIPAPKIPYVLVLKKYWFRLLCISIVWFIYDFITYPFSLYSSYLTSQILGDDKSQEDTLGWSLLVYCFNIPGAIIGAFLVDVLGPKKSLCLGLFLQIIVGYILSGLFGRLSNHIAAFCVVFGIFQSLGQLGAGSNMGLLASKLCATAVKGQFYGTAAAIGKIGAFSGSYAFNDLRSRWLNAAGKSTNNLSYTAPFYLASSLGCVSLLISLFFIPERHADCQIQEDASFQEFLAEHEFDMRLVGQSSSHNFVESSTPEERGSPDSCEKNPMYQS